jgi:predicted O-linked N-acetylglucosamine transferase (SPINDLY family)
MDKLTKKHNELILRLNEKRKTHPNLISFWINILNQKKKSYLKCYKDILENEKFLNDIKDLTKEQIILITYLNYN